MSPSNDIDDFIRQTLNHAPEDKLSEEFTERVMRKIEPLKSSAPTPALIHKNGWLLILGIIIGIFVWLVSVTSNITHPIFAYINQLKFGEYSLLKTEIFYCSMALFLLFFILEVIIIKRQLKV